MNTWTPVFASIVDSSIWSESDLVVKVFVTMLAKRGADNVVRGSAYQIGTWARKSEAEALEALKVLSSPDTKRLEPQKFEGRRVEKVEGGWLILNGEYYQDVMRSMNRKNYKAIKEREYRRRKKDKEVDNEAKCDGAKQAINEGLEGTGQ